MATLYLCIEVQGLPDDVDQEATREQVELLLNGEVQDAIKVIVEIAEYQG